MIEPIGVIAILGPLAVAALVWWSLHVAPPLARAHTSDCLSWRRRGERDNTCPMPHGTDWFGPATAELELTTTLDNQIGFRK